MFKRWLRKLIREEMRAQAKLAARSVRLVVENGSIDPQKIQVTERKP